MRITRLTITFERPIRADEKRNIVRKDAPYGPLHKRERSVNVSIPVGPETGANLAVKTAIVKMLRKHRRKEDAMFWVVGAFKKHGARKVSFYRTIVKRTILGGSGI